MEPSSHTMMPLPCHACLLACLLALSRRAGGKWKHLGPGYPSYSDTRYTQVRIHSIISIISISRFFIHFWSSGLATYSALVSSSNRLIVYWSTAQLVHSFRRPSSVIRRPPSAARLWHEYSSTRLQVLVYRYSSTGTRLQVLVYRYSSLVLVSSSDWSNAPRVKPSLSAALVFFLFCPHGATHPPAPSVTDVINSLLRTCAERERLRLYFLRTPYSVSAAEIFLRSCAREMPCGSAEGVKVDEGSRKGRKLASSTL
jgi:hypothetical protein